jgi:hypothetical protein
MGGVAMVAKRKSTKASHAPSPIRHVITLEATSLMLRLAQRQGEMVSLFSRLRDREALLAPFHSLLDSIAFESVASLTEPEQKSLSDFRELIHEMKWYLKFTEDMPTGVQLKLTSFIKRLEAAYAELSWALKNHQVVEGKVVKAKRHHTR